MIATTTLESPEQVFSALRAAEAPGAARTRSLRRLLARLCPKGRWWIVLLSIGIALAAPVWQSPNTSVAPGQVMARPGSGAAPVSLWAILRELPSPEPAASRATGLLLLAEAALIATALFARRFGVPPPSDQHEVLQTVSHDLRAPLASTEGYIKYLMACEPGTLNPEQLDLLNTALSNLNRLEHFVRDTLDLARLDAGRMRYDWEPVQLHEVARQVLQLFRFSALERGVRLANCLPGHLPAVRGDREKLVRILTNLVSNALKFTDEGGRVAIQASVLRKELVVTVVDNGLGMSPERLGSLLEKSSSPETVPAHPRGAELGLRIVRGLVEAHGGRVWGESQPGVGSRLHFTIPLASEARAGQLLGGRYEIVRQIGSGAMGMVFEGKDHMLDRLVAIKRMRPDAKLGGHDREQFLREAKTSASLHHPFIADIYDVLEEGAEIYLVFEHIDGESLDEFLDREGRMPADKTTEVLKQVCEALSFAHERKIAHRDLKPSNIMLSRRSYAKVTDFGIAREIKDTLSKVSECDSSGTYPYMAPEQELGLSDERSDLFALGVTAYELLAGELPFPGPNFYLQKEKGEFRPLAEVAPGTPPALAAAVERCMRFDPAERFAGVAEFAAAARTA